MPLPNNETNYCHLVDRQNTDNLIIPGTLTVAGQANVGAAPDIQTFTTAGGTWTKPTGAKMVSFALVSGGAGGGAGRRGAAGSIRSGGGGGAPGSRSVYTLPASSLPATLTVTVGAGSAGGLAATVDNTDGGTAANSSQTFVTGTGINLRSGVAPSGGAGGDADGSAGGSAGASFTGSSGGTGGASSATGGVGASGGTAAGGAGGGISSGDVSAAGGNGGVVFTSGFIAASAGGAAGAPGEAGTSSSTVVSPHIALWGTGGGGGGAGTAGIGGAGGFPGGGGGGGGASLNGNNSGAGGAGGDGTCVIISYF